MFELPEARAPSHLSAFERVRREHRERSAQVNGYRAQSERRPRSAQRPFFIASTGVGKGNHLAVHVPPDSVMTRGCFDSSLEVKTRTAVPDEAAVEHRNRRVARILSSHEALTTKHRALTQQTDAQDMLDCSLVSVLDTMHSSANSVLGSPVRSCMLGSPVPERDGGYAAAGALRDRNPKSEYYKKEDYFKDSVDSTSNAPRGGASLNSSMPVLLFPNGKPPHYRPVRMPGRPSLSDDWAYQHARKTLRNHSVPAPQHTASARPRSALR